MDIVDLSHNDDLRDVVRKCNTNFKKLSYSLAQSAKTQRREDADSIGQQIQDLASTIPSTVSSEVSDQINQMDIPNMVYDIVSDAISSALSVEMTSTLSDVMTEDGCTVTAINAIRWGSVVFIRFSYRLNSALTVPSNGDITDVTLGKLKIGWRPFDMTNVILDQTRILIGDVDSSGDIKARSANSRGTSYTIDANAVLYAGLMFVIGIQ